MSCKYKNVLGEPGKGVHSYRVFNLAIVDVVLTILGGYLISWAFETSFWLTTLVLFLIGIWAHYVFCVETTLNKLLFSN